jgi:hypothetical protein
MGQLQHPGLLMKQLARFLIPVALLQNSVWGAVHYVDVHGANVPPYTNWANAAVIIQDAVDAAGDSDEIWVGDGWYSSGGRLVGGVSNRVAVTKALKIQSVSGPEFTTIEGVQSQVATNRMRCVYLTNGAVLSGFTLTNGSIPSGSAGGVLGQSTAASVSNCVIVGNYYGGAATVSLVSCTILANQAANRGGGAQDCVLTDCTLSGNSSFQAGGAAGCLLSGCRLSGNSATWDGGGALGGTLYDCVLDGNSAQSTNPPPQAVFVTVQTNIPGLAGTTTLTDANFITANPAWYRVGVQQ